MNEGQTYTLAVSYDGSASPDGVRFYIDGVNKSLKITTNNLNETIQTDRPFNIGARNSASYPFNGTIDDVVIYNRTISQVEAAAYHETCQLQS